MRSARSSTEQEPPTISDQPPAERVFFTGYRGSGKTTVARIVAKKLGWEVVDSDDAVETKAGKSIARLFADDGEPSFRDLEQRVVADLCTQTQTVIALGGGAILRDATRRLVRESGPVFWLTASAETLAGRIAQDAATNDRRPSLTGLSGLAEVEQVLAAREPIYRECATFSIDGDGRDPASIADEVVALLAGG